MGCCPSIEDISRHHSPTEALLARESKTLTSSKRHQSIILLEGELRKTKFCNQCGASLHTGTFTARYCSQCGSPVQPEPENTNNNISSRRSDIATDQQQQRQPQQPQLQISNKDNNNPYLSPSHSRERGSRTTAQHLVSHPVSTTNSTTNQNVITTKPLPPIPSKTSNNNNTTNNNNNTKFHSVARLGLAAPQPQPQSSSSSSKPSNPPPSSVKSATHFSQGDLPNPHLVQSQPSQQQPIPPLSGFNRSKTSPLRLIKSENSHPQQPQNQNQNQNQNFQTTTTHPHRLINSSDRPSSNNPQPLLHFHQSNFRSHPNLIHANNKNNTTNTNNNTSNNNSNTPLLRSSQPVKHSSAALGTTTTEVRAVGPREVAGQKYGDYVIQYTEWKTDKPLTSSSNSLANHSVSSHSEKMSAS